MSKQEDKKGHRQPIYSERMRIISFNCPEHLIEYIEQHPAGNRSAVIRAGIELMQAQDREVA
jgi:Arc/MetJ-type ribon-helix-helix transcriptional regulator